MDSTRGAWSKRHDVGQGGDADGGARGEVGCIQFGRPRVAQGGLYLDCGRGCDDHDVATVVGGPGAILNILGAGADRPRIRFTNRKAAEVLVLGYGRLRQL